MSLFVGCWVAQYLGPKQYGIFSYAQSFVGLFTIFATLGLDGIVIRELVLHDNRRNVLLGTTFILKLLGALAVFGILVAALPFTHNNHETNTIVFIIASATLFQSFNVIDFYYQSKVLSKYIVISNSIALFFSSLFKIWLIYSHAKLESFAWAVLLDSIILSAGLLFFYYRENFTHWQIDWVLAKKLIQDGLPMILSGLAISVYMKIDQTMIKEILDEKSVGIYSAATKLTESFLFITVVITKSIFPALVEAKKTSELVFTRQLKKMYHILIFLAMILSISLTFFSQPLVVSTFGVDYQESVAILRVYLWSNIFVFLNSGAWTWYLIENLQKFAALRLLLGAFSNIILNYYFLSAFGLIGAAYATIISYSMASYFGNLLIQKTRAHFKLQSSALVGIFNYKNYTKEALFN